MIIFRHWKTPLKPSALEDATMSLTGCFSSIQFKTKTIYGQNLNVTAGSNRFIWALTHSAYTTSDYGGYAAYHSSADGDRTKRGKFRGHVHLDLSKGIALAGEGKVGLESNTTGRESSLSKAKQSFPGLLEFMHAVLIVCFMLSS